MNCPAVELRGIKTSKDRKKHKLGPYVFDGRHCHAFEYIF